jgi:hypothetical protein
VDRRERRQFLRVEADLGATCSTVDEEGRRGTPFPARTVDLSAGGALLASDQTVRRGERLWIELTFARPRFLVFCEAEVVRHRDSRSFAVQFLELDEYTQQRVVRWVYAEDRRLFDRHAQARIPVTIRVVCRRLLDGAPIEEFAAPSLELSGDELTIVSERVVPLQTTLQIELDLGEHEPPFSVQATVADTRPASDARTVYTLRLAGMGVAEERRLVERAVRIEREQRQ